MRFLKKTLPSGYSILIWKNANGEKRYTVFRGDDRLMSFDNKAAAIDHAISVHKNEG